MDRPASVPHLRARGLLRRLEECARDAALSGDPAPADSLVRPGREVGVVLHRQQTFREHAARAAQDALVATWLEAQAPRFPEGLAAGDRRGSALWRKTLFPHPAALPVAIFARRCCVA